MKDGSSVDGALRRLPVVVVFWRSAEAVCWHSQFNSSHSSVMLHIAAGNKSKHAAFDTACKVTRIACCLLCAVRR
jgi:hypothetical protein